eukprot:6330558-Prymnesium_polylepis.2
MLRSQAAISSSCSRRWRWARNWRNTCGLRCSRRCPFQARCDQSAQGGRVAATCNRSVVTPCRPVSSWSARSRRRTAHMVASSYRSHASAGSAGSAAAAAAGPSAATA